MANLADLVKIRQIKPLPNLMKIAIRQIKFSPKSLFFHPSSCITTEIFKTNYVLAIITKWNILDYENDYSL